MTVAYFVKSHDVLELCRDIVTGHHMGLEAVSTAVAPAWLVGGWEVPLPYDDGKALAADVHHCSVRNWRRSDDLRSYHRLQPTCVLSDLDGLRILLASAVSRSNGSIFPG